MAQALYLKERLQLFLESNGRGLPVVLGGDFNSSPLSSVMSIMHSEDILESGGGESVFRIPADATEQQAKYYNLIARLYRSLRDEGKLSLVDNNLTSAYNKYNAGCNSRLESQPAFTNWSVSFKGTMDHIFYNDKLEVRELLELPSAKEVCPNKLFPSDHFRIEAKF